MYLLLIFQTNSIKFYFQVLINCRINYFRNIFEKFFRLIFADFPLN